MGLALQSPSLEVKETTVQLEVVDSPYITIRRLHAPFELPKSVINYALSKYGVVIEHDFEYYKEFPEISTTVRVIKMKLNRAMPNNLDIGRFPVVIYYHGVVTTCYKCRETGHGARECKKRVNLGREQPLAAEFSEEENADAESVQTEEPITNSQEDMVVNDVPSFAGAVTGRNRQLSGGQSSNMPNEESLQLDASPARSHATTVGILEATTGNGFAQPPRIATPGPKRLSRKSQQENVSTGKKESSAAKRLRDRSASATSQRSSSVESFTSSNSVPSPSDVSEGKKPKK